jgi:hypothetical protein
MGLVGTASSRTRGLMKTTEIECIVID